MRALSSSIRDFAFALSMSLCVASSRPHDARHAFNLPILYQIQRPFRHTTGGAGLLCTKTRYASIAAITHIRFHMCQQIRFALTRDHESGVAMSRLMATWCCRGRATPRLRRASRPRHRQPCGFHRPAGHECRLRGTRIFTNGITKPIALQLPWDMMQSLREDPSCTLSTLSSSITGRDVPRSAEIPP